MTTIIRADRAFSAPLPDTPSIPDIESDLYIDFNAADLVGSYANGDPVTSWVGQGVAPMGNRTLSDKVSSFWSYPTFSADGGPGGGPTVSFAGANHIRTVADAVIPVNTPYSVAMVCSGRTDSTTSSHTARFLSTDTSGQLTVQPTQLGNVYVFVQGAAIMSSPSPLSHFVVVASLSDVRGIAQLSNLAAPLLKDVALTPTFGGFGFGGSSSFQPTNSLIGTITRAKFYSRALSPADVSALVNSLKTEYAIV